MARKKVGLFLVLLLIASGCAPHHVARRGLPATGANIQTVSLHGFFGGSENLPTVMKLIPLAVEPSPLPPCWDRGVPLACFEGMHKPLYLDFDAWGGEDNRAIYGLESSTLAFYVGHGDPLHWSVPREPLLSVPLSKVRGGDGLLRYFWLHSCNVMAHGPKDAQGDYSQPYNWSAGNLDVFERSRWTRVFRPGLRMVCGGSTQIGFDEVGEIWENLLGKQKSVSDAFVLGVAHLKQVPVCLARGDESPASSALADRTLHSEGFRYTVPGWLHLQMPVPCDVEPFGLALHVRCPAAAASAEPIASKLKALPVVTTTALPPPSPPEERRLPLGFKRLTDDSKYHPDSGAVVLIKGRDRYSPPDQCNQETTWVVNPKALLEENHLDPKLLPSTSPDVHGIQKSLKITALEMRVESRQDGAPIERRKCRVRSLFLRYDTEIKIGTESFPVFGPGIEFEVHRETPRLASFSAPNREFAFSAMLPMRIKLEEMAISEAHQELHLDPETYPERAAKAVLGYEEAPLRCKQEFLRPTYEIRFAPAKPDYPTVIVRRDARDSTDKSGPSWECRGWND